MRELSQIFCQDSAQSSASSQLWKWRFAYMMSLRTCLTILHAHGLQREHVSSLENSVITCEFFFCCFVCWCFVYLMRELSQIFCQDSAQSSASSQLWKWRFAYMMSLRTCLTILHAHGLQREHVSSLENSVITCEFFFCCFVCWCLN